MQTLKQFKKIKSKAAFDFGRIKQLSEARVIAVLILESTLVKLQPTLIPIIGICLLEDIFIIQTILMSI
jgi:hypothetical protein